MTETPEQPPRATARERHGRYSPGDPERQPGYAKAGRSHTLPLPAAGHGPETLQPGPSVSGAAARRRAPPAAPLSARRGPGGASRGARRSGPRSPGAGAGGRAAEAGGRGSPVLSFPSPAHTPPPREARRPPGAALRPPPGGGGWSGEGGGQRGALPLPRAAASPRLALPGRRGQAVPGAPRLRGAPARAGGRASPERPTPPCGTRHPWRPLRPGRSHRARAHPARALAGGSCACVVRPRVEAESTCCGSAGSSPGSGSNGNRKPIAG